MLTAADKQRLRRIRNKGTKEKGDPQFLLSVIEDLRTADVERIDKLARRMTVMGRRLAKRDQEAGRQFISGTMNQATAAEHRAKIAGKTDTLLKWVVGFTLGNWAMTLGLLAYIVLKNL